MYWYPWLLSMNIEVVEILVTKWNQSSINFSGQTIKTWWSIGCGLPRCDRGFTSCLSLALSLCSFSFPRNPRASLPIPIAVKIYTDREYIFLIWRHIPMACNERILVFSHIYFFACPPPRPFNSSRTCSHHKSEPQARVHASRACINNPVVFSSHSYSRLFA